MWRSVLMIFLFDYILVVQELYKSYIFRTNYINTQTFINNLPNFKSDWLKIYHKNQRINFRSNITNIYMYELFHFISHLLIDILLIKLINENDSVCIL